MQNAFATPSTILLPTVRTLNGASSPHETASQWIGQSGLDLIALDDDIELHGFQLYAVEKWIVERTRPIISLVVQTGDKSNKIRTTALRLSPSLSSSQTKRQWDLVMAHLKRGGTRPVQTEQGVVFTTSLAHFRSDYTIVHIPDGDFLSIQARLYANINLLRMGCTGTRGGAVGLEESSDSVKDRFISMYHFPEFSTSSVTPVNTHSTQEKQPDSSPTIPTSRAPHPNSRDEQAHTSSRTPLANQLLPSSHLHTPASSVASARTSVDQTRSASLPSPNTPNFPPHVHASPSKSGRGINTYGDFVLPVDNSTSPVLFPLLVLELGKLIQAGLLICGMLKVPTVAPPNKVTDVLPSSNRNSMSTGLSSKRNSRPMGSRSSSISGIDTIIAGTHPSSSTAMDSSTLEALVSDGLFCDVTMQGIKTWVEEIGEPLLGMERVERVGDPTFVSALLSFVLAMRNKAHALGYHNVPKDPFLKPHAFMQSLSPHGRHTLISPLPSPVPLGTANASASSINSSSHGYFTGHNHLSVPHFRSSTNPEHNTKTAPSTPAPETSGTSTPVIPSGSYLSRTVVQDINAHYARHASPSDAPAAARKMGRAILGRLDDISKRGGPDSNLSGEEDHAWNSDGNPSDGATNTSTNPLRAGIGSFASGKLGLGNKSGKGSDILEPQLDLETFVKGIIGKDKGWKSRNEKMAKRRSRRLSVGGVVDLSNQGGGQVRSDKERDAKEHERDMSVVYSVGGCIRGLWSGRCGNVVILRLREAERELQDPKGRFDEKKMDSHRRRLQRVRPKLSPASDGEGGDRSDPRSSDPEDLLTSGIGPWGGKVQRKLESWTKLNRRKGAPGSIDLSATASKGSLGRFSDVEDRRPSLGAHHRSTKRALSASPTLNPIIRIGSDIHEQNGDIPNFDLGFVSADDTTPRAEILPLHLKPAFNGIGLGTPSSSGHDQKALAVPGQKRPWGKRLVQTRVSSWSDPVSASAEAEEEHSRLEQKSKLRMGGSEPLLSLSSSSSNAPPARKLGSFARRRRSFHTLDNLRDLPVLKPDQMKIDVDLAGYFLIFWRREQHLRNLVGTLAIINQALPAANAFLRSHVESQSPAYATTEIRTKVIADIEAEKSKADAAELATNSVTYASEQFNIPQLYDTSNAARQRTFAMRESLFGTGGRRVPPGVHGAHGPYNRVQWTLDGRKRLVDALGRTESEVWEEEEVDPKHLFVTGKLEDEEDDTIVKHRAIKPVWLLGWFKGLGARWTTGSTAASTQLTEEPKDSSDVVEDKPGSPLSD